MGDYHDIVYVDQLIQELKKEKRAAAIGRQFIGLSKQVRKEGNEGSNKVGETRSGRERCRRRRFRGFGGDCWDRAVQGVGRVTVAGNTQSRREFRAKFIGKGGVGLDFTAGEPADE